jgi:general secretion pathway protein A
MYEAFYGFQEKPFNLTPDPKYLYLSAKHTEAFAHLEFGLKQRGGFVVITGEVGTGKTTLCRYFLERLDEDTHSAFILYPSLSAVELLRSVCEDLGITERGWTAKEWVDILHRFLLEARTEGKNIVLVIDEAQNLEIKVLEQIRLISNLETSTEKLIQIVLIGQSELNGLLSTTDLRQLAQRVTARYHLGAMNREETTDYIRHRLGIAGGAGKVSFTPGALRAIHRFSQGIPRLINLICDRALLGGYVRGRREIDAGMTKRSISELEGVRQQFKRRRWYHSWLFRGGAAAALIAALVWFFGPDVKRFAPWTTAGASEGSDQVSETIALDPPTPEPSAPAPSAVEVEAEPAEDIENTDAEGFETRLQTLSKNLSRRGAAAALVELWGVEIGGGVAALSPAEGLSAMGARMGLEVTELRTHLQQLRKLDIPVIVELFHTARTDTCFAAIVQLDEDTATVTFGPGDAIRIPISILESFWTRQAYVFWKDEENLSSLAPDDERVESWVREGLEETGYLSDNASSLEDLRADLARFQGANFLVADGVAGPRTKLTLYILSGKYQVPRLIEP